MTLQTKACPRCAGELRVTHDLYGMFYLCDQCGHIVEDAEPRSPERVR